MIKKIKKIQDLSLQDIRRYYREAAEDLREIINLILIAITAFLAGISIGLSFPEKFEGVLISFGKSTQHIMGKDAIALIGLIFLRNSIAAIISIVLGFFCGLVPIAAAALNGALIGVVLSKIELSNKLYALFTLIPHGIFELPAMFIAWGLGLWFGIYIFKKNKDTMEERRNRAFRIYFLVIVPLLLLAAIIEGIAITIADI